MQFASDKAVNGVSNQEIIDRLKQGCQLCHQLGNQITREITHLDRRFSTAAEAWDHRVTFGQRGARMNSVLNSMGRERAVRQFADWTDRIVAGGVPPHPPRPPPPPRAIAINPVNRIAFGDGRCSIFTVNSDGSDLVAVAGGAVDGGDLLYKFLVWSPDGGSLAFSSIFVVGGAITETSYHRADADGNGDV